MSAGRVACGRVPAILLAHAAAATDHIHLGVEARCQLRPLSDPSFEVAVAAIASPTGPQLAGDHSNRGHLKVIWSKLTVHDDAARKAATNSPKMSRRSPCLSAGEKLILKTVTPPA